MKLNRKSRRAQKNWRRPSPTDTPAQQFAAFLKAPGKMYAVELPEQKSFVVKVTEAEMPIFQTICQQLRGVLGHCEARGMTPVEAHVANTQEVAQSAAEATLRVRRARQRAQESTEHAEQTVDDLERARTRRETVAEADAALDASIRRHPAGKQRGGRHRAPELATTFDQLAALGADDTTEGAKRIAAIRIAAAQDQVAKAQDELERANSRLAEAIDTGGEIHNRDVIERFTQKASEIITEQTGQQTNMGINCPFCPASIQGTDEATVRATYAAHIAEHRRSSGITEDPNPGHYPRPEITGTVSREQEVGKVFAHNNPPTRELHRLDCQFDECGWSKVSRDKAELAQQYARHIEAHVESGSPYEPPPTHDGLGIGDASP